ncbi:hypothetical protein [Lyngbya confervoides]|uniref:Uncharacterized protein n=1 Tax=Lyngbya confervoides BDU141951 TaxID=1574623 RepID=A0ABD4T286_9CYAN|nr:hypothetical protein [Lyngbya confervoides]MCM1982741.1 hypothetical protein [Lyngbya confervoides BDU141951]
MARFTPYDLQLQITRMFAEGQSFFAKIKVQDWLKERQEDPAAYDIGFEKRPAPPESGLVFVVDIHLTRKDGQPVDPWLLEQLQTHAQSQDS